MKAVAEYRSQLSLSSWLSSTGQFKCSQKTFDPDSKTDSLRAILKPKNSSPTSRPMTYYIRKPP